MITTRKLVRLGIAPSQASEGRGPHAPAFSGHDFGDNVEFTEMEAIPATCISGGSTPQAHDAIVIECGVCRSGVSPAMCGTIPVLHVAILKRRLVSCSR